MEEKRLKKFLMKDKMKIFPVISDNTNSNTYILLDSKTRKYCIIDPGYSSAHLQKIITVLSGIEKIENFPEISPEFIINTHSHYDHIGNDAKIIKDKSTKIFMHPDDGNSIINFDDDKILSWWFIGSSDWFEEETKKIKDSIKFVQDEEIISLGGSKLKIFHTPGHTSGSISIYDEETKSLFSGDIVFSGGIGRTDLKSGNFDRLIHSIEKILTIDFKFVYPGHGNLLSYEDVKKIYEDVKLKENF